MLRVSLRLRGLLAHAGQAVRRPPFACAARAQNLCVPRTSLDTSSLPFWRQHVGCWSIAARFSAEPSAAAATSAKVEAEAAKADEEKDMKAILAKFSLEAFLPEVHTQIAAKTKVDLAQVKATLQLLMEENTVPFITRYRKEVTGGLEEDTIRGIQEAFKVAEAFIMRREFVRNKLQSLDVLTPQMTKALNEAKDIKVVEDIYLPYKPTRKSKAVTARALGAGPLGDELWTTRGRLSDKKFEVMIGEAMEHPAAKEANLTREEMVESVVHVFAEHIGTYAPVRKVVRRELTSNGLIQAQKTPSAAAGKIKAPRGSRQSDSGSNAARIISNFQSYFEYSSKAKNAKSSSVLAINRGEKLKVLKVSLVPPSHWDAHSQIRLASELPALKGKLVIDDSAKKSVMPVADIVSRAVDDAYTRLLYPSLSNEVRRELTAKAGVFGVEVFANNLRALLLTPPIKDRWVLGIDPSYRTGCKLALVNPTGDYVPFADGLPKVIFPNTGDAALPKAHAALTDILNAHRVDIIAIGAGTASRETRDFVNDVLKSMPDLDPRPTFVTVNEDGASVYSVSKEAQKELPEIVPEIRSTISIARRLQEPLAELLKIDPQSIGVGMYQHDMNQKELLTSLDAVVESCVAKVGVDVATASAALLRRVSGLNVTKAKKIISYRTKNPIFTRDQIMEVPGIGPASYKQACGFIRVYGGLQPLDETAVHPESYHIAEKLLAEMQLQMPSSNDHAQFEAFRTSLKAGAKDLDLEALAAQWGTDKYTLQDIVDFLYNKDYDPRSEFPQPVLRSDIRDIESLSQGEKLQGVVRNVIPSLGVFVDLGLKEKALMHPSQINPKKWAIRMGRNQEMKQFKGKNSYEQLRIGEIINVSITSVDLERGRISVKPSISVVRPQDDAQ